MQALGAACGALGAVVLLGCVTMLAWQRRRSGTASFAAAGMIASVFALAFLAGTFINQQSTRASALRAQFAQVLSAKYGAIVAGGPAALPGYATRVDDMSVIVGGSEKLCDVTTKVHPVDVVVTCGVELPHVKR